MRSSDWRTLCSSSDSELMPCRWALFTTTVFLCGWAVSKPVTISSSVAPVFARFSASRNWVVLSETNNRNVCHMRSFKQNNLVHLLWLLHSIFQSNETAAHSEKVSTPLAALGMQFGSAARFTPLLGEPSGSGGKECVSQIWLVLHLRPHLNQTDLTTMVTNTGSLCNWVISTHYGAAYEDGSDLCYEIRVCAMRRGCWYLL